MWEAPSSQDPPDNRGEAVTQFSGAGAGAQPSSVCSIARMVGSDVWTHLADEEDGALGTCTGDGPRPR